MTHHRAKLERIARRHDQLAAYFAARAAEAQTALEWTGAVSLHRRHANLSATALRAARGLCEIDSPTAA